MPRSEVLQDEVSTNAIPCSQAAQDSKNDGKHGSLAYVDSASINNFRIGWSFRYPQELILCSKPDDALAKCALEGLPNKVPAREYKLVLPDEKALAEELEKTRLTIEWKTR